MAITTNQLNAILDNADQIDDAQMFIDTAEVLIDSTSAANVYDSAHLNKIRLWLAAHLASAKNPPKASKQQGKSRESYQHVLGKGLDSTRYGQVLKMLDYKGYIVRKGKPLTLKAV